MDFNSSELTAIAYAQAIGHFQMLFSVVILQSLYSAMLSSWVVCQGLPA